MACRITGNLTAWSTDFKLRTKKASKFALLANCERDSSHKGPVIRKASLCHDVIETCHAPDPFHKWHFHLHLNSMKTPFASIPSPYISNHFCILHAWQYNWHAMCKICNDQFIRIRMDFFKYAGKMICKKSYENNRSLYRKMSTIHLELKSPKSYIYM